MRCYVISILLMSVLSGFAFGQEGTPLELAAPADNPVERHSHYKAMIEEYSGSPSGEDVWVIGLRGLAPDGTRHESSWSAAPYGDTFVVVRPDGLTQEFLGATHAGQKNSPECPWGVAQIRPGQYLGSPVSHGSEAAWRLLTTEGSEALPTWLDRDGDGVVRVEEKELDEHYGSQAKGLGLVNGVDPKRPRSVGAQTLPPQEFEKFVAAVGQRKRFRFLLLDANHPVKEESRDLTKLSSPLSPMDSFRYYERIALKSGVEPRFPLLVVVLRGMDPMGRRHASEDNMGPYNDTFLVLTRFVDGGGAAEAFLGSAHAGQASTTRSPGCYAGIAQIRPGLLFARSNDLYHGLWSWHVVNYESDDEGLVPAWRDQDQDGYISPSEKSRAESHRVTASEILIHNGMGKDVGDSIGCITMPPNVMRQFIDRVGEGSSFPLLLLDANSL